MIVVSMFLCVFYCSGLGIPYYGTQQHFTSAFTFLHLILLMHHVYLTAITFLTKFNNEYI